MKKALTWIGGLIVFSLAAYGAFVFLAGRLTENDGRKAVEASNPFVKGAASAAGEKLTETLKETPDDKLESTAEIMSRKLYPIAKGAIRGQVDAILNDSNAGDVPKKAYEAGKNVTERVLVPFAEGVTDGTVKALDSADKAAKAGRKFQEENQDTINAVSGALQSVGQALKEHAPPPPPFPGLGPPPPPVAPYPASPRVQPGNSPAQSN
ncbi:MAG: hypothetical protein V2B18_05975 [Pseudomonadota bacterium]